MAGTLTAHPPAPVPGESTFAYERHRPEATLLYQLVETHLPELVAHMEAQGSTVPGFVLREFEAFLDCGRLEGGFLRVKCAACRHEKLVAFSCKRRGFCPSCGGRRMAETGAFLVDEGFPHQPIRQWVVTFPFALRFLFAARPEAMSRVLEVINRAISTFIVKRSGLRVKSGAKTGAVTLVQRFGSALNVNIHFHMLYLDGAYERAAKSVRLPRAGGPPRHTNSTSCSRPSPSGWRAASSARACWCETRSRPR